MSLSINFIISAVVGSLAAGTVAFGGVQAYQSASGASDPKPVSQEKLFEYATE